MGHRCGYRVKKEYADHTEKQPIKHACQGGGTSGMKTSARIARISF